jgi:REP element-mobilizing transposase RayT
MFIFLVQSIPTKGQTEIIKMLKSITARGIFLQYLEVKKQLWGGEFWTDGYYVSTVGKHGDENTIFKFVRDQGVENEL